MNIGLAVGVSFSKPSIDTFNPKSVGTVTAWFDAKQQNGVRGSVVPQINDYSGNNMHATQATASKQGIIGSDGWFKFDGVDDNYTFGSVNANTVFAVVRLDVIKLFHTVLSKGYSLDVNNLRFNNGSYPNPGNGNDLQSIGTQAPFTSAGIWVNGGNSMAVSVNYRHMISTYVGSTDKALGCLGAGYIIDGARFLQGSLAEVIFYNEQLSSANRIKVEQYLLRKWGISYRA